MDQDYDKSTLFWVSLFVVGGFIIKLILYIAGIFGPPNSLLSFLAGVFSTLFYYEYLNGKKNVHSKATK